MKLLGALLCVGGMMVVSLLKGQLLHLWPTNLLGYSHAQAPASNAAAHHDMLMGTFLLCGSSLSYAVYFIVQVLPPQTSSEIDFVLLFYLLTSSHLLL
jgi:hypothetical protein